MRYSTSWLLLLLPLLSLTFALPGTALYAQDEGEDATTTEAESDTGTAEAADSTEDSGDAAETDTAGDDDAGEPDGDDPVADDAAAEDADDDTDSGMTSGAGAANEPAEDTGSGRTTIGGSGTSSNDTAAASNSSSGSAETTSEGPTRRLGETSDDDWERFFGPYINRGGDRSFATGMLQYAFDPDFGFGQIALLAMAEFSLSHIVDQPLSVIAMWGASLGYANNAGTRSALEGAHPVFVGAKYLLLSNAIFRLTAGALFGFGSDNVFSEYGPAMLHPNMEDMFIGINANATFVAIAGLLAFNAALQLEFNIGFNADEIAFTALFEVAVLATTLMTFRSGFDFHTFLSGANFFAQLDYILEGIGKHGLTLFAGIRFFFTNDRLFDGMLNVGGSFRF